VGIFTGRVLCRAAGYADVDTNSPAGQGFRARKVGIIRATAGPLRCVPPEVDWRSSVIALAGRHTQGSCEGPSLACISAWLLMESGGRTCAGPQGATCVVQRRRSPSRSLVMPSSSNPRTLPSSNNKGHHAPARHNQPLGMRLARWRFPLAHPLRSRHKRPGSRPDSRYPYAGLPTK